jgi:hypothetical protein
MLHYPDPAQVKDAELSNQWLDEICEDAEPTSEPIPSVCGMCSYHRSHPWDYCSLRASADLHPCNIPSSSSKAESCPFFEMEIPF